MGGRECEPGRSLFRGVPPVARGTFGLRRGRGSPLCLPARLLPHPRARDRQDDPRTRGRWSGLPPTSDRWSGLLPRNGRWSAHRLNRARHRLPEPRQPPRSTPPKQQGRGTAAAGGAWGRPTHIQSRAFPDAGRSRRGRAACLAWARRVDSPGGHPKGQGRQGDRKSAQEPGSWLTHSHSYIFASRPKSTRTLPARNAWQSNVSSILSPKSRYSK